MTTIEATLVLESASTCIHDPELAGSIARLAPHRVFSDATWSGSLVQRVSEGPERVVVGRFSRGTTSIDFMLASRTMLDIEALLATHLGDFESPFDYLVD